MANRRHRHVFIKFNDRQSLKTNVRAPVNAMRFPPKSSSRNLRRFRHYISFDSPYRTARSVTLYEEIDRRDYAARRQTFYSNIASLIKFNAVSRFVIACTCYRTSMLRPHVLQSALSKIIVKY